MPTPVSGANSCVYDPEPALDTSVRCDPTNATCGPPAEPAASPPAQPNEPGARQLVERFDAAKSRADCSLEGMNAAITCGKMTISAARAVASSGTGVVGALGLAGTFLDAFSCGRELRAYYDCKTDKTE